MTALGASALAEITDARAVQGYGGRFYGAYPGLVRDIRDPDNQGRVKVSLPWSPDGGGGSYETWARLATMMAGNNRGSWFVPDVNDEVLLVFLGGDPRHPCVVGSLWNGQDAPPKRMDGGGENNVKQLRSRNGVLVTLDDSNGRESLTLETPGGNTVTLSDGPGVIEVRDSNGNSMRLESSGITINTSAKVSITASQMEVSAGSVSVSAGMSTFSGTVKSDSHITNSTLSGSYSPGAGNMW